MRKGMPQVAKSASKVRKSASKVGKSGSRWAHFDPSRLTFEAGWATLASLGALLRTFKDFFCVFVQYS